MSYFSKNLTFLLKRAGIQHKELAEILGVRANTISNYKNAVSEPDFIQLEKIINFFKVTADDILYKNIEFTQQDEKSRILVSDSAVFSNLMDRVERLAAENAVLKAENERLIKDIKNKSNPGTYPSMVADPQLEYKKQ